MRKLLGLVLVLIVAVAVWQQREPVPAAQVGHASAVNPRYPETPSRHDAVPPGLPPEAADTLNRIAAGGPFEHDQDGSVFGNYERQLPSQPRGYYHEYTVETPGARTRGTRRIITGDTPPTVYYYTADHYRSFQRFEVRR